MKLSSLVLASAAVCSASVFQSGNQEPLVETQRYHIELSPSDTRWVTEEEKWALRREGVKFFDITDHTPETKYRLTEVAKAAKATVKYPSKTAHNDTLHGLLKKLDKNNMKEHLETFTGFHTRYYKSDYGRQSSEWLLAQVNKTLTDAGVGLVRHFPHPWGQNSIIATLPGKSEKTVVIGAVSRAKNTEPRDMR